VSVFDYLGLSSVKNASAYLNCLLTDDCSCIMILKKEHHSCFFCSTNSDLVMVKGNHLNLDLFTVITVNIISGLC
jgi:hypothetical protein